MRPWALMAATLLLAAASAAPDDFSARLTAGAADIGSAAARFEAARQAEAAAAAGPDRVRDFPLSLGAWRVRVEWSSDPTTGDDVLAGHLAFTPDAARCPRCRSIRLVQAARVETAPGRELDWTGAEANRNRVRSPGGFFIDHDAGKCLPGRPCSPYYRDSWPLADESQDGSNLGGSARAASLADYPFGWTQFESISLETCARCVETGRFLGCVRWGGEWPETGDRKLLPLSASETPSAEFLGALKAFGAFYAPPQVASR